MREASSSITQSRILAIRPGALGDTLLTLPTLAWLRRDRPDVHLLFVARRDVLPLIQASGLAEDTSPYDAPMWSALFADPLPPAAEAAQLVAGAMEALAWLDDSDGIVQRNLAALGAQRSVVVRSRPQPGDQTHVALLLAQAAQSLGNTPPATIADLLSVMPTFRVPREDRFHALRAWNALALSAEPRPVVALHPGSGGAAKRWPPAAFAALARTLIQAGIRPLLLEGPQDEPITGTLQSTLSASGDSALFVARDLSVGSLAAILQRCAAYIGNDSGVTHLAALLGLPVIALFGPTDPALWSPLGSRVHVIRSATGRMRDIPVATVAAMLTSLIFS